MIFTQAQWTDLLISKTRNVSLMTQGMTNWVLNFSLLFETLLALLLIYSPLLPQYIGIYPLEPQWWIPALPFALLILVMDELRRFLLRRDKSSAFGRFIYQETYY
jgi:sodium/potassium-transporting ATPase subunit alpha